MEKIDKVEYDKLFPEQKEFVEWVKIREQDSISWIQLLDQKKEIFNPFNTINS